MPHTLAIVAEEPFVNARPGGVRTTTIDASGGVRLRSVSTSVPHPHRGDWRDRRVIVAGGTSGFGLVLARHLAERGARVLVVGRSSESVRRALERLPAGPGRCLGTAADLARPGEGGRVVGEALDRLGGLDDLFFCVGRSGRARILATSATELSAFLEANVLAAVEITAAAAEDVAKAGGHMVYVGSLAGKLVTPWMGPYAVAKSALAAYVDAVRLEMTPRGAHVLLVSPGPIRREDDEAAFDRYAAEVARGGLPPEANRPGGGGLSRLEPDRLAERILEACRRRQSELVMPRKAAILAGIVEWFPDLGRRLLARFTRPDGKNEG